MISFLFFYLVILLFFSLIYQILGVELGLGFHGDYDYEQLDVFTAFYIHAFRNSIGDLSTPSYDYWLEMNDNGQEHAIFMIYIIWFFWLVNILFFTVLLLNFLIAVIS